MLTTLVVSLLLGPAAEMPPLGTAKTTPQELRSEAPPSAATCAKETRVETAITLLEAHAAYRAIAPFSLARTAIGLSATAPAAATESSANQSSHAGCKS